MIFSQSLKGFVWVRRCLGRVFAGLVHAPVKFWTREPKELTDGSAQDSQNLPCFSRESLEHGPWSAE